jgi:MFS family permease
VTVQFLTPEMFGGDRSFFAMGGAHRLATLAGAAALFPAGAARDRFGARPVLLAANLLAAASVGILSLTLGHRALLVLLPLLVFNFANATNTVVALAKGMRGLSKAGSSVSALLLGLPWLAAAPAPSLAGLLADHHRGGTLNSALVLLGLCSPLAAAVALSLRRKPPLARDLAPTG